MVPLKINMNQKKRPRMGNLAKAYAARAAKETALPAPTTP
jgi:hypothetical protein